MPKRFPAAWAVAAALMVGGLSACGGTLATKTVTVTTTTAPKPTATTSAPPADKERTKPRSKAHAASAMRSCDANITPKRATTSCRFAENVFYGYWNARDQGDDAFTAYSPVTKQSYSMSCTGEATVVCRAGDGGEVHFPMTAVRAYTAENAVHYAATHDTGPSSPFDPRTKHDAREAERYWSALKRHRQYLAGLLGGLSGVGKISAWLLPPHRWRQRGLRTARRRLVGIWQRIRPGLTTQRGPSLDHALLRRGVWANTTGENDRGLWPPGPPYGSPSGRCRSSGRASDGRSAGSAGRRRRAPFDRCHSFCSPCDSAATRACQGRS
jgi:hypothetical protein